MIGGRSGPQSRVACAVKKPTFCEKVNMSRSRETRAGGTASAQPVATRGRLDERQWRDVHRAARIARATGVTITVHGVVKWLPRSAQTFPGTSREMALLELFSEWDGKRKKWDGKFVLSFFCRKHSQFWQLGENWEAISLICTG